MFALAYLPYYTSSNPFNQYVLDSLSKIYHDKLTYPHVRPYYPQK